MRSTTPARDGLALSSLAAGTSGADDRCLFGNIVVLARRIVVIRFLPLEEQVALPLIDTEMPTVLADGAGIVHGGEHGPVDIDDRRVRCNH